jgi:NAD(P)-dependent dehydrogenase (short-subunit alcohol dehydrogenase family)
MMKKHARQKAIITGAACGLGRSLSLALAAEGWQIGIVDINVDDANTTLEEVRRKGADGEIFSCDVADLDQVEAMAEHFFTLWGSVDLMVNNAGVATVGDVGSMPMSEWRRLIDIDLFGVIHGCHAVIPKMKRQGYGYIVNTASAAGVASLPGMSAYNVCKAGVISLSETLKVELAPFHIGVSVICPTFFKSDLIHSFHSGGHPFFETTKTGFENTRVTSDIIAQRFIHSLKRGTFYIFPQTNAIQVWFTKRFAPSLYLRLLAFLNGRGKLEPLLDAMAQRGQL